MVSFRKRLRLGGALLSMWLWACGSGSAAAPDPEYQRLARAGTVEPKSELEREILEALPGMEPGEPVEVGDGRAVADREYAAASGRTCRYVTIYAPRDAGASSRLACRQNSAWSFVPEVLAPESPMIESADEQPSAAGPAVRSAEPGGGIQ